MTFKLTPAIYSCFFVFLALCLAVDLRAANEKIRTIVSWPLSQESGNIAEDISGNGYTGIIHGATWNKNDKGAFLEFDGIDDYIEFPKSPVINDPFDIELDLIPYKISEYNARILSKGDTASGSPGSYYFSIFQGGSELNVILSDGEKKLKLSGRLKINSVNHVRIIWSGKLLRLYINGTLTARSSFEGLLNPNSKNSKLYIGKSSIGSFFNGTISNVKISEINGSSEVSEEENYIIPLWNNSFVDCTNPGLPDFWGNEIITGYFHEWNSASFHTENNIPSPVNGAVPLRIQVPDGNKNFMLNYGAFEYYPSLSVNCPYTISIYMKAMVKDTPVAIMIANKAKTFKVSENWERYSYHFSLTPKDSLQGHICISIPPKHTVWITAPQLETGKQATEFKAPKRENIYQPAIKNSSFIIPFQTAVLNKDLLILQPELSYYTTESEAALLLKWDMSEKVRIDILRPNDNKDFTVFHSFENELPGKKIVNIPLAGIAAGNTKIIARAYSGDRQLAEAETILVKLPENPVEVKINHLKRNLKVNGNPWFLYCMNWSSPVRKDEKVWQLEDIKAHGFTCIRIPALEKVSDMPLLEDRNGKYWQFLNRCQQAGLAVIIGIQPGTAIPGGRQSDIAIHKDAVTRIINSLKQHPAIIAWNFIDEPEGLGSSGKPFWEETGKNEKDLVDLYNAVKKADAYRPAFINYGVNVWNKKPYGGYNAFDIGSSDVYTIGHTNSAFYPPSFSQVIGEIQGLNSACKKYYKPSHFFAQLTWLGFREPTPAEEKFINYINLIYGTRLFSYFTYKPMNSKLWDYMSILGKELNILTDIAGANDFKEIALGSYENIMHYNVWNAKGKTYLLIANGSYDIHNVELKLTDQLFQNFSVVKTLFTEKKIEIKEKILHDTFEPLECKVYEFQK